MLLDHFIISDKEDYKLFSVGSGFKSVLTVKDHTLRSGKEVKGWETERRHRNLQAALNSKLRPDMVIVKEIIKQTY